jgi:hypothetical protein
VSGMVVVEDVFVVVVLSVFGFKVVMDDSNSVVVVDDVVDEVNTAWHSSNVMFVTWYKSKIHLVSFLAVQFNKAAQ